MIGGGDWAEDRIVPDCVRAWSQDNVLNYEVLMPTRPWQHVLEPLSGYLTLASALSLEQFTWSSLQLWPSIKLQS